MITAVDYVGTEQVRLVDLAPFPAWSDVVEVAEQVEVIRRTLRTVGQFRSLAVRESVGGGRRMVLADHATFAALLAEDWQTARVEIFTCTDLEAGEVAGVW